MTQPYQSHECSIVSRLTAWAGDRMTTGHTLSQSLDQLKLFSVVIVVLIFLYIYNYVLTTVNVRLYIALKHMFFSQVFNFVG